MSLITTNSASKSGTVTTEGTVSSSVYGSLNTESLMTSLSEDLKDKVQESLLDDNKLELADLLSQSGNEWSIVCRRTCAMVVLSGA